MNNQIDEPSLWHQQAWDRGEVRISSIIRPSRRKPWAMVWTATYKNGDIIAFMEYPNSDFSAAVGSEIVHVEDYRDIINLSEKQIGLDIDMRFIHPRYAVVKKGISRTIRQMLSGPCRACLQVVSCKEYEDLTEKDEEFQKANGSCRHKLNYVAWPDYPGADRDGYMRMTEAIGTEDVRARFYTIKSSTPNLIYALQNYAWADEKDVQNEDAEDKNSEFPSLIAGGYLKRFEKWPEEHGPIPQASVRKLWKPRLAPRKA